jgi:hypothetical protein
LLVQTGRERDVLLYSPAIVVHDAEPDAALGSTILTSLLEQTSGAGFVPENVFAREELGGKDVAGICVPCGAGLTQTLGFLASGIARGE